MNTNFLKPPDVIEVSATLIEDDGTFPNNGRYSLIVYRDVFLSADLCLPENIETLFDSNHWPSAWRNGVYPFHHYHSNAHEALGVYEGNATIQLGGASGIKAEVGAGDIILIPAGVAHKRLDSSGGFALVGAYPEGQHPDMRYGKDEERQEVLENIAGVPMPAADPVFGKTGGIRELW
jgi:uncharacterized protein YjlB